MRIIKVAVLSLCAAALCAILGPGAKADAWNEKIVVTFNYPVEIPGQVLSAGTYVFKLADSIADHRIVEIGTENETQLLATLLTVPDYRPESTNKTIFEFDERPGDSPMAIHSWFYSGSHTGQQFIYFQ